MVTLLLCASRKDRIDAWLGADDAPVRELTAKMAEFHSKAQRHATTADVIAMLSLAGCSAGLSGYLSVVLADAVKAAGSEVLDKIALGSPALWQVGGWGWCAHGVGVREPLESR
jgi:hypothetical protein